MALRDFGFVSYSCQFEDRSEHLRCASAPDRPLVGRGLRSDRIGPDCTCDCHAKELVNA